MAFTGNLQSQIIANWIARTCRRASSEKNNVIVPESGIPSDRRHGRKPNKQSGCEARNGNQAVCLVLDFLHKRVSPSLDETSGRVAWPQFSGPVISPNWPLPLSSFERRPCGFAGRRRSVSTFPPARVAP